jgi:hypothetical protein
MKVAELIQKLSALPQDLDVYVGSNDVHLAGNPQALELFLENDVDGLPDRTKPSTKCCTLLPLSVTEREEAWKGVLEHWEEVETAPLAEMAK